MLRKLYRIRQGITHIYFVRHAQPVLIWEDDRTRPLTEEGLSDTKRVTEILKDINIDYVLSSPYTRSINTISDCAKEHNLTIHTEERFRERKKGPGGNEYGMFTKRWSNFDFMKKAENL